MEPTITISRKEYDLLKSYEEIVLSEVDQSFDDLRSGRVIRVR